MAISDPASMLAALRNLTSTEAQITAFRAIKNNIIGHDLRKIDYVRAGILSAIAELLQNLQQSQAGDREDQLWQEVINIITSIAYAGPSFVRPILNSSIQTSLLPRLLSEPPPKLTLAILRCLNVIAENLPLSSPSDWGPDKRLARLLCTTETATRLVQYVSIPDGSSPLSQQVCDAALALICKTCTDKQHKDLLTRVGLMSTLAKRLASFVVSQGLVIPSFDTHSADVQDRVPAPKPAPIYAHLSPVLETLCLLVEGSKANAILLLENPNLISVLPPTSDEFLPSDIHRGPWGGTYLSGGAVPRPRTRNPIDWLLPHVPSPEISEPGGSFPPLSASMSAIGRRSSSIRPASEARPILKMEETNDYQEKSLLIPWLLLTAHSYRGKNSLLACQLLVMLFKHNLIPSSRIATFKTLTTPALVQLLDVKQPEDEIAESYLLTRISYVRIVPSVLARLIMDDEKLQKVAVDGQAITKLAACLKSTFEPPNQKAALWRPTKGSPVRLDEGLDCDLGLSGPTLEQRHIMYHREGLLQALAAIAPFNDLYRKEICDQGVLTQIKLALEPFHSGTTIDNHDDYESISSGNSASTILAACDAVRALTRSVTALRTKLVDAEIEKAILILLHSPDPEVRISATKVVANLAVDFSPMKSAISQPAFVETLCDQAHSANPRLRLESIWALKHLVLRSDNKLKKDVIDELGTDWIRQVIATDPYNIPPGEIIGLTKKDYSSRKSQPAGPSDMIMREELDDDDDDDDEAMSINSAGDNAAEYTKHTVEDDLAIQEQILHLLRNLFCGEKASEIIDYVLSEMGERDFMQILMDRLKSKTTVGATRKSNQTSHAPTGTVSSTLFIIVHMAACAPKFRTMLTTDQALMRQILVFHSHEDCDVRTAICWIAINLTYGDTAADRDQCRIRAIDMNRAGWLSCMKRLENDNEMDIRERAKTAASQMEKLLPHRSF